MTNVLNFKKESNKIGKVVPKRTDRYNNGGGNNMSGYVTKEEFNLAIKDLNHQIELNQEKNNSKLEIISEKLDNSVDTISDKIQISLDAKDKEDKKENRETRRYVFGTIMLGFLGLGVSIISLLF